jgi:DMSO/TMAO reductase YedYZ molybdopterin-dependent catalytic subunit
VEERLIGRGVFLGVLAAGIAGLFWGREARRALNRLVPDGVQSALGTGGWRIYTISGSLPRIAPSDYRLTIDGLVERPQTLTLRDVEALPRAEQVSDFHCVTGWSVYGVRWAGVRFDDLLEAASPLPSASWLRFHSTEEPYVDTLSLEQALLPDAMLAYEMDGGPLSRAHGAPARVVMPQMYGYKSVKWVTRIELASEFEPGFWERHGYDSDAWVGRSNGIGA